jgi:shikimate kinase
MGSGKSTVGRMLAKEMNTYFLDTDILIESFENRTIKDIFENDGEETFREMERRCFEWIKSHVTSTIISVGGGLPVFIPQIREAGVVIYLKVDFNEIVKRLDKKEMEKRPLFQDIQKARELFEKRDNVYSSLADIVIENKDVKNTIQKIKDYYASYEQHGFTNGNSG